MSLSCRLMSFASIALAASTIVAAAQATSQHAAPPKGDLSLGSQALATAGGRDGAGPGNATAAIGDPLAENAWDFNVPNGAPGFGPIRATDDVRAMVAGMHSGARLLDNPLAASVESIGGSKAGDPPAGADRSVSLYGWANRVLGAR
jgi:hypothetical protein